MAGSAHLHIPTDVELLDWNYGDATVRILDADEASQGDRQGLQEMLDLMRDAEVPASPPWREA